MRSLKTLRCHRRDLQRQIQRTSVSPFTADLLRAHVNSEVTLPYLRFRFLALVVSDKQGLKEAQDKPNGQKCYAFQGEALKLEE